MAFSFLIQCIQTEERGMPMTKIIYLDIDGTLRDERLGIPESAETALRICREQGILIVICTGRNQISILYNRSKRGRIISLHTKKITIDCRYRSSIVYHF